MLLLWLAPCCPALVLLLSLVGVWGGDWPKGCCWCAVLLLLLLLWVWEVWALSEAARALQAAAAVGGRGLVAPLNSSCTSEKSTEMLRASVLLLVGGCERLQAPAVVPATAGSRESCRLLLLSVVQLLHWMLKGAPALAKCEGMCQRCTIKCVTIQCYELTAVTCKHQNSAVSLWYDTVH